MKTRETFPGKTYSVHTANGCTVSDDSGWSKEIYAPDGYFTAHDSSVYLSDDEATMREVFKLAPQQKLALLGVLGGNPAWLAELRAGLDELGVVYKLAWMAAGEKLVVHTDRLDDTQLEQVTALLERVLPQNIEVERYNHHIDIDWRDWPIPRGYTQLEYLESSGTQRINTQFIPAEEVQIEVEYMELSQIAAYCVICGVNEMTNIGTWRLNISHDVRQLQTEYGWWRGITSTEQNKKYRVYFLSKVNDWKTCVTKVDGEVLPNVETPGVSYPKGGMTEGSQPMYMFDRNTTKNGIPQATTPFYGRIYMLSLKNTNGKESLFVPALDPTGAPCMYDTVTRKAFYNQGTGDFLYPTETTTYALRRVLPDWGKLTPNGLRRLYHAPKGYTGELYDYALENGYKPIVETEQPEDGYWMPQWRETEEEIVLEWVESEAPIEMPQQENED